MHASPRQRLLMAYAIAVCASAGVLMCWLPGERVGIVVMLAISLAAAWVVAWFSTRSIRRQVRQLREAAEAARRGETDAPIRTEPQEDFLKLADTMRRLTEQLQDTLREQEQLRRRLTRSEKLAIIGELAATVAHEINNPLDGLQNCTRIIRRSPENLEQMRQLLDLMDTGLYRIEMIVRRLLSMSRDEPVHPVPTAVQDVVNDAVAFVQPRLDRNKVRLVRDFPETPVVALADRPQMTQVMINLMINAADSMRGGGGVLTITGGNMSDGEHVRLQVSDTGRGIDPEHLPHIFEPFYTTKGCGAGTGLGLSVVSRIVEAHGGRIGVSSEPGKGTCFRIELPSVAERLRGADAEAPALKSM